MNCGLCGQEKTTFHSVDLCIVCDNPPIGEGAWFVNWLRSMDPED